MDHSVVIAGAGPVGDPRQQAAGPVPAPRSGGPVPVRPHAVRPPTSLVCVLLCEDREVFRTGLRVVLEAEPDMAVVPENPHLPAGLHAAPGAGPLGGLLPLGPVAGGALPLS